MAATLLPDILPYDSSRPASFPDNGRKLTDDAHNQANAFPAAANVWHSSTGDIGDPRTAAKIVDTAVSRFGRIDVLVNNAGIFIPKPFTELHDRRSKRFGLYDTCWLSLRFTVSGEADVAAERAAASSTCQPPSWTSRSQAYRLAVQVMAKGSLHAVTRALAIEYAKDGIRVNTVALGVIKTPMHKPETYESLKGLHPMGRMGEIKEVVDAVLFLTDATFTHW